MKTICYTTALTLWFVSTLFGQMDISNVKIQHEVKKLDFLIGNWTGEGWMLGYEGEKIAIRKNKNIQYKLDKTSVLFECYSSSDAQTIQEEIAVLRYEAIEGFYSYNSFRLDGNKDQCRAELKDGILYWYPNHFVSSLRYSLRLQDDGQLLEIGERKKGDSWVQFSEVVMKRE